jgi:HK97 family phage prohead protease
MHYKYVNSTAEYFSLAKRGEASGVALLRDTPPFDPKSLADDPLSCTMSTTTPNGDLAGDSIKAWTRDGMDIAPLLWSHQADRTPIGRLLGVKFADGRLTCSLKFIPASVSPFAAQIETMVRGGWIRTCSVGFIPLRIKASTDPQRRFGYDIELARLIELSIVNCPCNPEALIGASAPKSAEQLLADERKAAARREVARMLTPLDTPAKRIAHARALRREFES